MADQALLQILQRGVGEWNEWRRQHPGATYPDLFGADLPFAELAGANLSGVNLSHADLDRADLADADLTGARLADTHLAGAKLSRARLSHTTLYAVNFSAADLSDADLSGASLVGTQLFGARLSRTKFYGSTASHTAFVDLDLRGAEGLEAIIHAGPSEVGIGTIYKSEGDIPEVFLRGCGVPESFIAQIPALVAAMQPIQFHSCFISYSGRDEEFARRLHSRMREADLRVWFAPEDMKGGDKLYDQIDRAIQVHDRLLLVLSESSLRSKWVELEIRRARKVEVRQGRRKLFPIRLVSYEALQEWVCIDSATGEDLAEEVRGYFIPDFSNWKSHDDFEQAFARLLADLRASA